MTFPAQNVTVGAKIRSHYRMSSPEPITISATVLAQLFLCLDSLRMDIDAFLRSLDIEPEGEAFEKSGRYLASLAT